MKLKSIVMLAVLGGVVSLPVCAQVIFYASENFQGRMFTADQEVRNFVNFGFNDLASSVVVLDERWLVCQDVDFKGRCKVLRPGRYPSLRTMGLNNMISSTRMIDGERQVDATRFAPPPVPVYDSRRRNEERIFQADVSSSRAVVGPPKQRCWVEQQVVNERVNERGRANVPGALVGALLGGVLGHQIGGGSGRDIATAGGAVAGAVIGSNTGREREVQPGYTHDVRRCANVQSNARPEYWDVTYEFRGVEHHIQLANPPGSTISVNEQGEPRS
jgi:uncharacterized protein YcfJ